MTRSHWDRNAKHRRNRHMPAGSTRADVVVMIALIVLLSGFAIVLCLPAYAKVRMTYTRGRCSSHLSSIGKAMLAYAHDYDGMFPRAGSPGSVWGPVAWNAPTRQVAYDLDANGVGGKASVSSSLYLLVRYVDLPPVSFICPADKGVRKWSGERVNGAAAKLTACWDFGSNPQTHCSYTYQWPFGDTRLTTSSEPGLAVAADRNPWLPSPRLKAKPFPTSPDGKLTFQGRLGDYRDQIYGNTSVHGGNVQSVLFLDGHVTLEKRAYCGVEEDNIYTRSIYPDKGDPLGGVVAPWTLQRSANPKDSILVHDPPSWPAAAGQK